MNKIKTIVIFGLLVLIMNCGSSETKYIDTGLYGISINNENEAYVILYTRIGDREEVSYDFYGHTLTGDEDENRSGTYLGKVNFQDNTTTTIKKVGRLYSQIVCKNNVIAIGGSEGTQFLRMDNYEVIKTITEWNFHDFTADMNKMIIDSGSIYEYNDITKVKTILKPFPNDFRDAKYCPTNETVIAYIGASNTADNMTGDIYLINNDATGNTLVLSGYDAIKLCWHPDGNRIVFVTANSIYSINKDGSNVTFIKNFTPPETNYHSDIYYNLFVYKTSHMDIKTIRF